MADFYLSESARFKRGSKRSKTFPVHDHAHIKFISTGIVLTHTLALLKTHHVYGIPLHEVIYDTQEATLGEIHPNYRPRDNYHLWHGYSIPRYGCKRLDAQQWFYANTVQQPSTTKDTECVAGYTIITPHRRGAADYVADITSKFTNTKIFVHDKIGGISNFVPRPEYLSWIARSKYTAVIPPYDSTAISIYRIVEALQLDCIPLIHPACKIDELEQSFNISLQDIVCTPDWVPFTDSEYSATLDRYKTAFLQYQHGFTNVTEFKR